MTSTASDTPSRQRSPFLALTVFIQLWIQLWWWTVGALLMPWLAGGGWTILALSGLLFGIVGFQVHTLVRGFRDRIPPTAGRRLWVLRPFWYTLLLLPVLAWISLAGVLLGLPFGRGGDVGRGFMVVGLVAIGLGIVFGYVGSRRLVVRHLTVHTPDLPPAFDGLRIVQLSDLHVGPHTSKAFLNRIVRTAQGLTPDLVVHTGDQVDDYADDIRHFAAAFAELRAPLGVFAVAGNHDIFAGWRGVERGLEAMGTQVLVNDAVPVARDGDVLWLAGTGDPAAGSPVLARPGSPAPDIPKTLRRIPRGAFTIALAHNPALWPALVDRGVQLTLSGHTHYGQVAVPSRNWSLVSPFLELAMETYRRDGSLLYINPGTNYWGLPLRLGALPEITHLTLRRTAGDPRFETSPPAPAPP